MVIPSQAFGYDQVYYLFLSLWLLAGFQLEVCPVLVTTDRSPIGDVCAMRMCYTGMAFCCWQHTHYLGNTICH